MNLLILFLLHALSPTPFATDTDAATSTNKCADGFISTWFGCVPIVTKAETTANSKPTMTMQSTENSILTKASTEPKLETMESSSTTTRSTTSSETSALPEDSILDLTSSLETTTTSVQESTPVLTETSSETTPSLTSKSSTTSSSTTRLEKTTTDEHSTASPETIGTSEKTDGTKTSSRTSSIPITESTQSSEKSSTTSTTIPSAGYSSAPTAMTTETSSTSSTRISIPAEDSTSTETSKSSSTTTSSTTNSGSAIITDFIESTTSDSATRTTEKSTLTGHSTSGTVAETPATTVILSTTGFENNKPIEDSTENTEASTDGTPVVFTTISSTTSTEKTTPTDQSIPTTHTDPETSTPSMATSTISSTTSSEKITTTEYSSTPTTMTTETSSTSSTRSSTSDEDPTSLETSESSTSSTTSATNPEGTTHAEQMTNSIETKPGVPSASTVFATSSSKITTPSETTLSSTTTPEYLASQWSTTSSGHLSEGTTSLLPTSSRSEQHEDEETTQFITDESAFSPSTTSNSHPTDFSSKELSTSSRNLTTGSTSPAATVSSTDSTKVSTQESTPSPSSTVGSAFLTSKDLSATASFSRSSSSFGSQTSTSSHSPSSSKTGAETSTTKSSSIDPRISSDESTTLSATVHASPRSKDLLESSSASSSKSSVLSTSSMPISSSSDAISTDSTTTNAKVTTSSEGSVTTGSEDQSTKMSVELSTEAAATSTSESSVVTSSLGTTSKIPAILETNTGFVPEASITLTAPVPVSSSSSTKVVPDVSSETTITPSKPSDVILESSRAPMSTPSQPVLDVSPSHQTSESDKEETSSFSPAPVFSSGSDTATTTARLTTSNAASPTTASRTTESSTRPSATSEASGSQTSSSKESRTSSTPTSKTPSSTPTSSPQCPDGYLIGAFSCFLLVGPSEKTRSYQAALSYCKTKERQTLASMDKIKGDLKLIKEAAALKGIDLLFDNGLGGRKERFEKKADVYSIYEQTLINSVIVKTVGISDIVGNVSAICVLPHHDNPNECDVEKFFLAYDFYSQFKTSGGTLKPRQTSTVTCLHGNQKSVTVTCNTLGAVYPHPTNIGCQEEGENGRTLRDTTNETVSSCKVCFGRGTKECEEILREDGEVEGYRCICREPYYMARCWKTRNACTPNACGPNGVCHSEIGQRICVCNWGYSGESCEINLRDTFYQEAGYMTYTGATITLGEGLLKIVKIAVLGYSLSSPQGSDPQGTHQRLRTFCTVSAGFIMTMWSNPTVFGITQPSCRFHFIAFHFSYMMAMMQWLLEGFNVNQVLRGVHLNEWETDFFGQRSWGVRVLPRMAISTAIIAAVLLLTFSCGWYKLAAEWTCLGVICQETLTVWFPVFILVFIMILFAAAAWEQSYLTFWRRPLLAYRIDMKIERELGFERGQQVNKCRENAALSFIGIVLLAVQYVFVILSSDYKENTFLGVAALLSAGIYSCFCSYQEIMTNPEERGKYLEIMQRYFPQRFAPDYNPITTWTFAEVRDHFALPKSEREAVLESFLSRNQQLMIHHRWDIKLNQILTEDTELSVNLALSRLLREEMHHLEVNGGTSAQERAILLCYTAYMDSIPSTNPREGESRLRGRLELVTLAAEDEKYIGGVRIARFFIVPKFHTFEPEIPDGLRATASQRNHKRKRMEQIEADIYRMARDEALAQTTFLNSSIHFMNYGNKIVR